MDQKVKNSIKQIIGVFETGSAIPKYDVVTILRDGAGISYGSHQATDKSGSLDKIVYRYIDLGGRYGEQMRPFLDELAANATTNLNPKSPPEWCKDFMILLSKAGKEDPLMAQAQEESIDEGYFNPAESESLKLGLTHPLSFAVVFDSYIQSGGISKIRRLFAEVPPVRGGDEKEWIRAYVRARRAWLASFPNPVVMKTVYRMDAFLDLIKKDNWDLQTPFAVRGQTIQ